MKRSCKPHRVRAASVRKPLLVTFSGIDGSGKTTQIEELAAWMRDAGLRVTLFRFWDDVAAVGRVRETLSHVLFKSEKGVGSRDKPVQRRDKNVRGWYMTSARLFLYFLDALRLCLVWATATRTDTDVAVFDRYIYDELANLNLENATVRVYARLLLKMVPRPDVAFLVDADPKLARPRKPEYPLDFLHAHRARYMALSKMTQGLRVIGPAAIPETTRRVVDVVAAVLHRVGLGASSTGPILFTAESHQ